MDCSHFGEFSRILVSAKHEDGTNTPLRVLEIKSKSKTASSKEIQA